MKLMIRVLMGCVLLVGALLAEEGAKDKLDKLKLPGVNIDPTNKWVDIDAEICLDQGALELIACTKNTKEHEAIVAVDAKAIHIHMALLLLGASAGNPETHKQIGEGEDQRWMVIPPRGHPVNVALVVEDEEGVWHEHPIADFLMRYSEEEEMDEWEAQVAAQRGDNRNKPRKEDQFPTSTFIFTGSLLVDNGEGPRRYIADESGNLITIANFGDETLGLTGRHSHENGELAWQVNPDVVPELGTKVKLRLTPVFAAEPPKKPQVAKPEESPEGKPEKPQEVKPEKAAEEAPKAK